MSDLELFNNLGVPAYVITIGAILWILKIVGILDGVSNILKIKLDIEKDQESHQRSLDAEASKARRLRQLTEDYSESWLLEQISLYSSEALVQVGASNEFIRKEVYETIKVLAEKTILLDKIYSEIQQIRVRLGELYSEVDLLSRRLEELSREDHSERR